MPDREQAGQEFRAAGLAVHVCAAVQARGTGGLGSAGASRGPRPSGGPLTLRLNVTTARARIWGRQWGVEGGGGPLGASERGHPSDLEEVLPHRCVPGAKSLLGPWAPVTASLADDAADTPPCMQWRPGAASSRTSPVPEKFCAHWALRPQIPFSSPGLQMWWLYSPGAPASWDIVQVPQDTTQGPGRASRGRRRLRQQDLPWVCEQGPAALPM